MGIEGFSTEPVMKAYSGVAEYDGSASTVFAKNNLQARKILSEEINGGELSGISVNRIRWADRFRDLGYIPKTELLEDGFWFECESCGNTISSASKECREAVDIGDSIHCSISCYVEDRDRSRIKKAMSDRVMLWAAHKLKAMYPRAVPILNTRMPYRSFSCLVDVGEAGPVVRQFILPFMWDDDANHGYAHYRYEGGEKPPYVSVARGDMDLFEKWSKGV